MRILVLSQCYWPESFRINDVVKSLMEQGCQIDVLTGQPNYPDGQIFRGYRPLGVSVQRGPAGERIQRVPLMPRGRGGALRLAANYLSFTTMASLLGPWLLRDRRYDVVFVYAPSPILQAIAGITLARIMQIPVVTWVQDLWPQSLEVTGYVRNRRVLDAVSAVVRWIYQRCDLLLAQSRAFVPAIRALAGTTPVLYLPNPGATESPGTALAAPELQLGNGFNIVFAGNLGSVQALDTVLEAAELLHEVPDVRFTLVGSGSRSAWLAEEIERRGLRNVTLPGRFDPSAMPAIYAQADALLVSLNKSDILSQTIPSKVQSYLAAGRPILASLDGEGAQVVRDANAGFSTPAEDAFALAEAVRALRACTPEQRQAMGRNAQHFYRTHFEPHEVARTLQVQLRSAIERRGAPGYDK